MLAKDLIVPLKKSISHFSSALPLITTMITQHNPSASSSQEDYLFSMMLGLAVTRWVLVPTSSTYFFESGGRLHLKKEQSTYDILAIISHTLHWRVLHTHGA